jgi:hypothetical protein
MTGFINFINSSPAAPKPSVFVGPGLTAFTVQPYLAGNSFAQTRVKASTMPFVPAYMVCMGGDSRAEMLQILTMRESFAERWGSTACVRRKVPRPLRLTRLSQWARVCCSKGRLTAISASGCAPRLEKGLLIAPPSNKGVTILGSTYY